MSNGEELTDDYVASLLAKDAKETGIRYSVVGLEAFSSAKPTNKPKPNTRFLRNIIKDTDTHNAALLAKEAAEAKARLNGLSTNTRRAEKASRLGHGDIRQRQLGNIASILGGQPSKRQRTESPKRAKRQKVVDDIMEDEAPELDTVRVSKPTERSVIDLRKRQLGDIAAMLGGISSKSHRTGTIPSRRDSRRQDGPGEDDTKEDRFKIRSMKIDSEETRNGDRRPRDRDDQLDSSRSHRKDSSHIRTVAINSEDLGDGHRSRRKRPDELEHDLKIRGHGGERRRRRSRSDDRDTRQHVSVEDRQDDRRRQKARSRSRSPREHRSEKSRHRHRSPRRKYSESPEPVRESSHRSRRNKSTSPNRVSKHGSKTSTTEDIKMNYDSDPLDDIIGPRPPPIPQVRSRGRGAISHGSGIDSRFASNYDPTVDVQLDPDEENDWDQALEALRDRQKWKQSGADRLRAAGFTDEEVLKWEKGGEKREEDVKWSKRGESREWDRGKVMDEETGTITHEPNWGRLKDT